MRPRGGFAALPLRENVLHTLERLVDHESATVEEYDYPSTVEDWIENWAEDGLVTARNWSDGDRNLEEDVVYAFAYLHGVGDGLDMTMLEVWDAWKAEQPKGDQ